MSAFLFAFLAVVLAGTGARDQLTLAVLSERQGARPAALVVALACAGVAALVAASASLGALSLPGGVRRTVLVLAIALAGIELLFTRALKVPREPTESLAALGIVLIARQLTDAARLLIFALAAATQAPLAAGMGGAVGGGAVLALGWSLPQAMARREIVLVRRALGVTALGGALLAMFA